MHPILNSTEIGLVYQDAVLHDPGAEIFQEASIPQNEEELGHRLLIAATSHEMYPEVDPWGHHRAAVVPCLIPGSE
jgi:hypothetical protein